MPPRVCSFWLMWYDGVITFFKGVICSGAEILACQVCINVCWLYVFVVYFRWLQRTSPTYHKEEPPFTAPRKLPVDPLSLTKEQKEKLSAPGPADCWAVGAKLWFSTVFQDSDCLTAWCNMTHIEIQIWTCEGFRGLVWFGTTPQWGISTVSRYAAQRHARLWPFALPASDLGMFIEAT